MGNMIYANVIFFKRKIKISYTNKIVDIMCELEGLCQKHQDNKGGRASARAYHDKKNALITEKEKIEKILEAALVAPTACNLQPQRILVLTDKNIIKALDDEKCTRYTFDAPLIFVMCVDRSKAWTRKYDGISSAEVDSSITMTQMMLQAQELGLGTTWVMALNPDIAKKVLNIPENLDVISFMPTGYPADDAEINPLHYKHIDIDEMVKFNKF